MTTAAKGGGKKLGLLCFILTEILIVVAVILMPRTDILPALYVQLGVMSLVWGSVSYKNHIDYKTQNGGRNVKGD